MEWVYSHDYGDGLKLMEHSYVGNPFVGVVMNLMRKGNKWHKKPIVWCGDYYDEEKYYKKIKDDDKINPADIMGESEQRKAILVNHTKKEYARFCQSDLKGIKKKVTDRLKGNDEWEISILPLLTALGNGRGGGDYEGTNMDKIGIWAKDMLSVEFEVPEGHKELKVEFKERRI